MSSPMQATGPIDDDGHPVPIDDDLDSTKNEPPF